MELRVFMGWVLIIGILLGQLILLVVRVVLVGILMGPGEIIERC
ncbi:hypothetical protein HanXRQr2_Chr07g0283341 [Helianthus annuus]|uniref:Uncharacterized protein n=1 Tax=Helianthus annuus TaxID=4232 RepID=A0A9K3IIS6_HELAN|nr:hypothetical protein HanXRQr2_Chr07g0283341 [Helianthus annuus]KAJ0903803.1 hypothetical protein HanPSC8_Chr07g0274191 [Helianthus annuus]